MGFSFSGLGDSLSDAFGGLTGKKGYDTAAQGARDAQAQANALSQLQWQRQMQGLQEARGQTQPYLSLYDRIYGTQMAGHQTPVGGAGGMGGMGGPGSDGSGGSGGIGPTKPPYYGLGGAGPTNPPPHYGLGGAGPTVPPPNYGLGGAGPANPPPYYGLGGIGGAQAPIMPRTRSSAADAMARGTYAGLSIEAMSSSPIDSIRWPPTSPASRSPWHFEFRLQRSDRAQR